MALALPSGAFRNVQQYLRQKRATGRRVSPTEEKSAWSAYWNAMYGMRAEGTRLGLEKERIETGKEQFTETMALEKKKVADVGKRFATSTALTREQIKAGERAAMISGGIQLAGTAALGAHVLKGTKIGEKLWLGEATTATKPLTPGVTAGALAGAGGPGFVQVGGATALPLEGGGYAAVNMPAGATATEAGEITAGGVAQTAALVYGGAKVLEATEGVKEIPKEIAEVGGFVADIFEKPIEAVFKFVGGGK